MGLFGPSRRERFVRQQATSLAIYLKDNSVKFGGEAYAKCQAAGVFPAEINESLLWYFWRAVFAFRVAQECLLLRPSLDQDTFHMLFMGFVDMDNNYFKKKILPEPYKEVFAYVSDAADVIKANSGKTQKDHAQLFMLYSIKSVPIVSELDENRRFHVVYNLSEAMLSFPGLDSIIKSGS